MFTHQTTIRVRYAETDQMGFVYYGQYASYLEVGRVEALRTLGIRYSSLEESGILMPVTDLHIKNLLVMMSYCSLKPVLKLCLNRVFFFIIQCIMNQWNF